MRPTRTLVVLGCGTSVGVPMIGCGCGVCTSADVRNHRTRASVLFHFPAGNLLVDTSPELRLQFLREKIPVAHAVAYTHAHADHLFGLDDVRLFPKAIGGPLPLYCTGDVEEAIRQSFGYAFADPAVVPSTGFVPQLAFRRITDRPFEAVGQTVTPIPLVHGNFRVFGYRVGDVAYCTDVSEIPAASWPLLEGLDVLILDALRPGMPHPSHFCLDQALDVARRVKPGRTFLTHMSHEMDYASLAAYLPAGVAPAHDGLRIDF